MNNKTLKLTSLILGTVIWALLWQYQTDSRWVEVPVCFYNVPEQMKVACDHEKITIQVRGKLADLAACDNLGLHINAAGFKPGTMRVCPEQQQLFLPKSVKLVHSKPLYLEITTASA